MHFMCMYLQYFGAVVWMAGRIYAKILKVFFWGPDLNLSNSRNVVQKMLKCGRNSHCIKVMEHTTNFLDR